MYAIRSYYEPRQSHGFARHRHGRHRRAVLGDVICIERVIVRVTAVPTGRPRVVRGRDADAEMACLGVIEPVVLVVDADLELDGVARGISEVGWRESYNFV